MTGLVRKATILAVLGLLITSAVALAGIPDPSRCTYPSFIDVMGNNAGVVDPYGAFVVNVLDYGNNPVVGCAVTITINCADVTICAPAPTIVGQTPSCVSAGVKQVVAYTDALGNAYFDIAGASNNTGGLAAGCGYNGATITLCNAIYLGQATVTTFDENGAATMAGMEVTDLSAWLKDFGAVGTIGYKGRSDFSHLNGLDVIDLSRWLVVFGLGNSPNGCAGSYCP